MTWERHDSHGVYWSSSNPATYAVVAGTFEYEWIEYRWNGYSALTAYVLLGIGEPLGIRDTAEQCFELANQLENPEF